MSAQPQTTPAPISDPSFKCAAYTEQYADWTLVNDCLKGTKAIIAKGDTYLPQEPKESDKAYSIRLKRAKFWNAYRRTLAGLVGMIFRKNPVLGKDVSPEIVSHCENIDLIGTHLDVFAKRICESAINDGHTLILVEMPKPITAENPRATLKDERASGRRPYWVHYTKDQLINWRTEQRDGVVVLVQATLCEQIIEPVDDFKEEKIEQWRVLRPGQWFVIRKANDATSGYYVYEQGLTSLDFIPLIPVYANKTGYLTSDPVLLDLAHENLRHYRLQSDLDNIIHATCVPIRYGVGVPEERDAVGNMKPLEIGPNSFVRLNGDNAKIGYAEPAGSGIAPAQEELEKSKANMAALGLSVLAHQPKSQKTATGEVMEYEAQSSELSGIARGVEDALETALMFHGRYLGLPIKRDGSIAVNKDFSKLVLDPGTISAISNEVAVDHLPLEVLWWKLRKAEELPPDLTDEKMRELIEDQIARRGAGVPVEPMPEQVA